MYIATPEASNDVVEIATGTALSTLLQVAVPSTTDVRIAGWGISFDGTSASAAPGKVQLVDTAAAATGGTSLTPEKLGNPRQQASLCVGGAALTCYDPSAEGSITDARMLDPQNIHPQTGYSVWWYDKGPIVLPSRFVRIRAIFAADVNAIPWIAWYEPVE